MTNLTRSPSILLAVIETLKVETNEAYRPGHLGAGLTWCNRFVSDVTELLGCQIPFRLANAQLEWLGGLDGAAAGWRELIGPVRLIVAIDQAERGFPTVAVWANPKGHGHIAVCVPGEKGKLTIAQAGASNFSSGPIVRGFGAHPYRLFTHA